MASRSDSRRVLPPEHLSGVDTGRLRDSWRPWVWMYRGWVHGALHGQWLSGLMLAAPVVGVVAVATAPARPVFVLLLAVILLVPPVDAIAQALSQRSRVYFSPARDAVLVVTTTRRGWLLAGHAAARPGAGQGRALREVAIPQVMAAADASGVVIYLEAGTGGLAATYRAEVPGLVSTGHSWLGRARLERQPVDLSQRT